MQAMNPPPDHFEPNPWLVFALRWSRRLAVAAGFFVGIVVGLTGMGGGALMTPALIFLNVGNTATVIAAKLPAQMATQIRTNV